MYKKDYKIKRVISKVIMIIVTLGLSLMPSSNFIFLSSDQMWNNSTMFPHNTGETDTAYAQTQDDGWATPINVSNSGGTASPLIVADSNQLVHLFWQDVLGGMLYSNWDGINWAEPISGSYPFTGFTPKLVPDGNGYIHAIWTNLRGELAYSRGRSASVGNASGWESTKILAESAVKADLTVDAQGGVHLIFVRTLNNSFGSSGVYYRRSTDGGNRWLNVTQIYSSAQIRTLDTQSANIHLRTTETEAGILVYAVWDNQPLKRIFFSKSIDRGATWGDAQEVEGPETTLGTSFPYDIDLIVSGDQVLLFWKSGQPGASCIQFSQLSNNRGETWGERQTQFADLSGCPTEITILQYSSELTLLVGIVSDQVYLAAWDGENWSQPQIQQTLSTFTNPVTFDTVQLGCRNVAITTTGILYLTGCDEGQGGDIWVTWYSVTNLDNWFPPPPIWSGPLEVYSTDYIINNLASISDQQGRMHLVYNQVDPSYSAILPETIYYSYLDANDWSQAVAILESPRGRADYPSLAIEGGDRFVIVWHGGEQGEIFYSWANVDQAEFVSEWNKPVSLPVIRNAARYPDILSFDKTIIIAYTISLNESRGIYIVRSQDSGATWEGPILVFDGASAGWENVGAPKLARSENGTLLLFWSQNGSPDWAGVLGLTAATSDDNGNTWSDESTVVEQSIDWYEVLGGNGAILHRFWQEIDINGVNNYHQYSLDSGVTWSGKISISSFGYYPDMIDVVQDQAGGLHFVEINLQDDRQSVVVNNWTFRDNYWVFSESFSLGNLQNIEPHKIEAELNQQGKLVVVCNVRQIDSQGNPLQYQLLSFEKQLEIDYTSVPTQVVNEIINVQTPELSIATMESAIINQEATPTAPKFSGEDSIPTLIDPTWLSLAWGGVISVVLILAAVFLFFRRHH